MLVTRSYLPVFPSVSEMMKEFEQMWNLAEPVSYLSSKLLSGGFPPTDYYADEDGTLHFDFAVAGYKEEDIDLTFEDDHLILKLSPKKEEDKKEWKYFVKRVKYSESELKAYVPFSKYDVNEAKAEMTDGMLKVSIPVREDSKPVKLQIEKK
jgi:HSP20 family molecular chaperone IbpA